MESIKNLWYAILYYGGSPGDHQFLIIKKLNKEDMYFSEEC